MFIRIRTINGKQYRYLQWSVREGKKVRTKSIYLGRVGGGLHAFIEANFKVEPGHNAAEKQFDKWAAKEKAPAEKTGASHAGAGNQPDAVEGAGPDGDHK